MTPVLWVSLSSHDPPSCHVGSRHPGEITFTTVMSVGASWLESKEITEVKHINIQYSCYKSDSNSETVHKHTRQVYKAQLRANKEARLLPKCSCTT